MKFGDYLVSRKIYKSTGFTKEERVIREYCNIKSRLKDVDENALDEFLRKYYSKEPLPLLKSWNAWVGYNEKLLRTKRKTCAKAKNIANPLTEYLRFDPQFSHGDLLLSEYENLRSSWGGFRDHGERTEAKFQATAYVLCKYNFWDRETFNKFRDALWKRISNGRDALYNERKGKKGD